MNTETDRDPDTAQDEPPEQGSPSHLRDLNPSNPRFVCNKGHAVFEQGAPAHQAFFVEDGRLEVVVIEDGQEIKIAEIGPGEVFGEMGALEHKARMATVRALEKTTVTIISRRELEARIEETTDPLIQSIIRQLLQRLRSADHAQVQSHRDLALFQDRLLGLMDKTRNGISPDRRDDFRDDVMPLLDQLEAVLKKYQL